MDEIENAIQFKIIDKSSNIDVYCCENIHIYALNIL